MKLIKICGLAAVVAMAVALFAAPAAMGGTSTLCVSNEGGEEVCKNGNNLGELHYEGTEPTRILTSSINVTCESLFEGTAFGLFTNAPVKIIGKFTYTNCNGSCKVEQIIESELKLLRTGSNVGTVAGIIKVNVFCSLFIDCTYTFEGLSAGATGANLPATAGKFTISGQTLKTVGGPSCPMTSKLDMALESLDDVYIKE